MRSFLALILFLFLSLPARAALEVSKQFLEDPTASLTIEDLMARPESGDWQPVTKSKAQFGSTHARVWLRFFLPKM